MSDPDATGSLHAVFGALGQATHCSVVQHDILVRGGALRGALGDGVPAENRDFNVAGAWKPTPAPAVAVADRHN